MAQAVASGGVIWMTGPPCSGKTTLATTLHRTFDEEEAALFDGDEVRKTVSKDLSHGAKDRKTNLLRVLALIQKSMERKSWAICAFVSPDASLRNFTKEFFEKSGTPFYEVYVHAETEKLIDRDVKGLYKRAIEGEEGVLLPGYNDAYDIPTAPALDINTGSCSLDEAVVLLRNRLITRLD